MNANYFVDVLENNLIEGKNQLNLPNEYILDLKNLIIEGEKIRLDVTNTTPPAHPTFSPVPTPSVYYEINYPTLEDGYKPMPTYCCAYDLNNVEEPEETQGFFISPLHMDENKFYISHLILYVSPDVENNSYNMSVIDVNTGQPIGSTEENQELISNMFALADSVMSANTFVSVEHDAYVVTPKEEINKDRTDSGKLPFFNFYYYKDVEI